MARSVLPVSTFMAEFYRDLISRLPRVGTTIFARMSQLAHETGAINLAQGFPMFDPDPQLVERAAHWMRAGANQYAPLGGEPALCEVIARRIAARDHAHYDPATEITITVGATQAIYSAIAAFVHPGDEVVIFEPAYDSYAPAIELHGGRVVRLRLSPPHYRPDWSALAGVLGPRTRMVILNTPHNPSARVWSRADLETLDGMLRDTGVLVLADEVYEHIVFDRARHTSCAALPGLAERALVVSSFGKTLHVTGWKVGYVAAPGALTREVRKQHQFNVFSVATPFQRALADYLTQHDPAPALADFYAARRDCLRAALAGSRFTLLPVDGTFFQPLAYRALSDEPDTAFVERLAREHGVAAIPVSAFHADGHDEGVIRLCFARDDATLQAAAQRLCVL